jgi:uncharacterized membrane-anchored protein
MRLPPIWRAIWWLLPCLLFVAAEARAQAISPDEAKKIFEEARAAAQPGPGEVALAGQARLKLPSGHLFVPQPQAGRMLNAMGNPGQDPRLQGLIFPQGEREGWFITVRYEPSGYIKDDDARDWNADELLKSYRDGTEAANQERKKMGAAELEILGWAEQPAYDAGTHRLAWAMASREKGAPAAEPQGVNYNTYVLGREGYFMLNLVTGLAELPAHKPAAQQMLAALQFDEGKRYADFNAGTDRVAEYGLAALVVGAAAKKLGLLAAAGLFFAKFGKIALLALAGLGALAVKIVKGRKAKDSAVTPPAG